MPRGNGPWVPMWGQEKGDSYSFLSILTEHLLPVLVMGAGSPRESLVTRVVWEMDTKMAVVVM